jgi:hypothetical protein
MPENQEVVSFQRSDLLEDIHIKVIVGDVHFKGTFNIFCTKTILNGLCISIEVWMHRGVLQINTH